MDAPQSQSLHSLRLATRICRTRIACRTDRGVISCREAGRIKREGSVSLRRSRHNNGSLVALLKALIVGDLAMNAFVARAFGAVPKIPAGVQAPSVPCLAKLLMLSPVSMKRISFKSERHASDS